MAALERAAELAVAREQARADPQRVAVARQRDRAHERGLDQEHAAVARVPQRRHAAQLDRRVDDAGNGDREERRQCDAPEALQHVLHERTARGRVERPQPRQPRPGERHDAAEPERPGRKVDDVGGDRDAARACRVGVPRQRQRHQADERGEARADARARRRQCERQRDRTDQDQPRHPGRVPEQVGVQRGAAEALAGGVGVRQGAGGAREQGDDPGRQDAPPQQRRPCPRGLVLVAGHHQPAGRAQRRAACQQRGREDAAEQEQHRRVRERPQEHVPPATAGERITE